MANTQSIQLAQRLVRELNLQEDVTLLPIARNLVAMLQAEDRSKPARDPNLEVGDLVDRLDHEMKEACASFPEAMAVWEVVFKAVLRGYSPDRTAIEAARQTSTSARTRARFREGDVPQGVAWPGADPKRSHHKKRLLPRVPGCDPVYEL